MMLWGQLVTPPPPPELASGGVYEIAFSMSHNTLTKYANTTEKQL